MESRTQLYGTQKYLLSLGAMKKHKHYYFYGLLLIGVFIRLYAYLFNRALWFDEALLANNIINLSFEELTGVLPNNQAAPIAFLFLQKILITFFGSSEYVLRFAPLLVSLLSIGLFYRLSQKILSWKFSLLALAFFIFCQPHIYYSTELKQYSFDVFASILLLLSTANLLENPSRSHRFQLAFLGVLLVWFSQPIVFVLAASFVALSFRFYQKRDQHNGKALAGIALSWAISFGVYFFCFLAPSIANSQLQDFHLAYFMPLNISLKETWEWYFNAWFGLFRNPVGVLFKYLAGSITGIAIFWAFRKKMLWLILLLLPVALAFAASALHKYSTIPRLLLFALPALLLLMSTAFQWFYQSLKSYHKWGHYFSGLIIALVFLQPVLDTIHEIAKPEEIEEIKPVLAYIAQHKQVDDLLYIYPYALPQFEYYKEKYGLAQMKQKEGKSPFENWQKEIGELRKDQRVWLLLSHYRKLPQTNDAKLYTKHFDQYGKQIAKIEEKGSVCYLYEFESLKTIE